MASRYTTPVSFTVQVPEQVLLDLLSTAIEGGSTYWANFSAAVRSSDGEYLSVVVTEQDSHKEGSPRIIRALAATDLIVGLERLAAVAVNDEHDMQRMAGQHLGDALSENGDASTADVVLQMALFGEVIYG